MLRIFARNFCWLRVVLVRIYFRVKLGEAFRHEIIHLPGHMLKGTMGGSIVVLFWFDIYI